MVTAGFGRGALRCKIGVRRLSGRIRLGHRRHRKGNLANCDSIPFTTLANYVHKVEQWDGISVFTWHASNPVTGKTANDCSTQNAVKQVIENDSVQKKFLASLDKVAQFLGNLKDEAGEPIPVIFQPFHGHDSDTALWWSTTQCSASDFKNLWKLTVNYLQNEKDVHNLLYAYSVYSNDPADILPAYYPGNDFVDIIGINSLLLQGDGCSGREFIQELNEGIAFVTQFAAKNKKIAAVTSTGLEGIKISDFFSKYLYPVISQYKLSFVLFEKTHGTKRSTISYRFRDIRPVKISFALSLIPTFLLATTSKNNTHDNTQKDYETHEYKQTRFH